MRANLAFFEKLQWKLIIFPPIQVFIQTNEDEQNNNNNNGENKYNDNNNRNEAYFFLGVYAKISFSLHLHASIC